MLLAIDTCANHCAIGLFKQVAGQVTTVKISVESMERGHAERLVPVLDQLFLDVGNSMSDIKRIAVTVGPGSFTGSRIGVAAARALALPYNTLVLGVTTQSAVAKAVVGLELNEAKPFSVLLNARRGEFFVQSYDDSGSEDGERVVLDKDSFQDTVDVGASTFFGVDPDLAATINAPLAYTAINAGDLVCALAQCGATMPEPSDKPKPFYVRPPDAKPQIGKSIARR